MFDYFARSAGNLLLEAGSVKQVYANFHKDFHKPVEKENFHKISTEANNRPGLSARSSPLGKWKRD